MKISTHDVDPGQAVPRVGVRFVKCHDVGKVGELGVLLLQADLYLKNACDESRKDFFSQNEDADKARQT